MFLSLLAVLIMITAQSWPELPQDTQWPELPQDTPWPASLDRTGRHFNSDEAYAQWVYEHGTYGVDWILDDDPRF